MNSGAKTFGKLSKFPERYPRVKKTRKSSFFNEKEARY